MEPVLVISYSLKTNIVERGPTSGYSGHGLPMHIVSDASWGVRPAMR